MENDHPAVATQSRYAYTGDDDDSIVRFLETKKKQKIGREVARLSGGRYQRAIVVRW